MGCFWLLFSVVAVVLGDTDRGDGYITCTYVSASTSLGKHILKENLFSNVLNTHTHTIISCQSLFFSTRDFLGTSTCWDSQDFDHSEIIPDMFIFSAVRFYRACRSSPALPPPDSCKRTFQVSSSHRSRHPYLMLWKKAFHFLLQIGWIKGDD